MKNDIYKKIYVEYIKSIELDIEIFIKLFSNGYNKNIENINKKVNKMKQKYINNRNIDVDDIFSSDYEEILITPKYFFNICCVILYSELEKKLKGILENIFESNTKNCYKYKEMQKIFCNNGINITEIEDYEYINEIRELNNCIKHDGYVSIDLENISNKRYKYEDEIDLSEQIIINYSNNIKKFLYGLYNKVNKILSKSNGTEQDCNCTPPIECLKLSGNEKYRWN
jgi:hypothetical protein